MPGRKETIANLHRRADRIAHQPLDLQGGGTNAYGKLVNTDSRLPVEFKQHGESLPGRRRSATPRTRPGTAGEWVVYYPAPYRRQRRAAAQDERIPRPSDHRLGENHADLTALTRHESAADGDYPCLRIGGTEMEVQAAPRTNCVGSTGQQRHFASQHCAGAPHLIAHQHSTALRFRNLDTGERDGGAAAGPGFDHRLSMHLDSTHASAQPGREDDHLRFAPECAAPHRAGDHRARPAHGKSTIYR